MIILLYISAIDVWKLSSCGLMMPYGIRYLGQTLFRYVASRLQTSGYLVSAWMCYPYHFRHCINGTLVSAIATVDKCLIQPVNKHRETTPLIIQNRRILVLCTSDSKGIYWIMLSQCWRLSLYIQEGKTHVCTPQTLLSLIARFLGPTWGPSGADRAQVVPSF